MQRKPAPRVNCTRKKFEIIVLKPDRNVGNNHASQNVHETERREIILPICGGAGLSEFSVQVSDVKVHMQRKRAPRVDCTRKKKIRNYCTEARQEGWETTMPPRTYTKLRGVK